MKKNINQILDYKNFIFLLIGLTFIIRVIVIYIYHDKQIEQEWEIILYNLIKYKTYSYYGPTVPSVMLPPLYPFLLYILKLLTFEKISLISFLIFFQIILSTISVYIFYKINQKIFSNKISLINSFIYSFFPLNIYSAGQTSSITLQVFLSLLFILLFISLTENLSKKKILLFSLISGFLILARGEFILVYLFSLFFLFLKNKIKIINLISIIFFTLLLISPYLIRNYNTFNQIVLVKSLGFNLWKGNNKFSTVEGYGDINFEFYNLSSTDDIKRLHFKNLNNKIEELEKNKFYELNKDEILLKQAIKNLGDTPLKYLNLFLKKILSFYFINFNSTLSLYYNFFHYIPILVIGIFSFPGLVLALKEKEFKIKYLIFYFILTIMIFSVFFILPRYKLAILPLQIIFAAYFIKYIFKKLNKNVI